VTFEKSCFQKIIIKTDFELRIRIRAFAKISMNILKLVHRTQVRGDYSLQLFTKGWHKSK